MKIAIVYNRQSASVINLFGQLNREKIGLKTIDRLKSALKDGGHQVIAVITPAAPCDWWSGAVDSLRFRSRRFLDEQWYVLTVGAWGVFLPLALADVRAVARRVRENLDLAALVLAAYASAILSRETEPLLAFAWPAVAAAGAAGFRGLVSAIRVPFRSPFQRLAALGLGAQLVHFGLTRGNDPSGSGLDPSENPAVAGLMFLLWLVWAAAATWSQPRP